MVESSVEYIERDVEAADVEEEEREPVAWEVATITKLTVPVAATVFVFLFLNSVIGRIGIENLYYPLSVIGTLLLILATVYITEILEIYREYTEQPISARSNLRRLFEEWKVSLALLFAGVVYLVLVPLLGFFPASFLGMIAIMLLGGARDWRVIVLTTVLILSLIYVLFVVVANLPAPEGPLGI